VKKNKQTFGSGDIVRIINGPFMGLEGTVSDVKEPFNKVILSVKMIGRALMVEVGSELLSLVTSLKDIIRKELEVAVKPISSQLIYDLGRRPEELYSLSGRQFEELVAELMEDMGYSVHLTPQTRDGGRDILAYFDLPHGKALTVVDCKRFSKHRKIGPDIIERLMWVAQQKDHASQAMIATTSYFTSGARELEKQYEWQLNLKDFNSMKEWLSQYGKWKRQDTENLWLPKSVLSDAFSKDITKAQPLECLVNQHGKNQSLVRNHLS